MNSSKFLKLSYADIFNINPIKKFFMELFRKNARGQK